jgi:hypothetical protein
VTRLLVAGACALVLACAETPTSLSVRAAYPDGEPVEASFLDVTLGGLDGGESKLVYARPSLDGGGLEQTFVVILAAPAVGRTVDVLVEARAAGPAVDLPIDAGSVAGRVVAAGSGSVFIVGGRDNALTIPLTPR